MTTINLQQNHQENQARFSGKRGGSGFVFSIGILVVTLLVLAGLKAYVPFAEGKNTELIKEIAVKNQELAGLKSLEKVADMQKRLEEIKSNLQIKNGKINRVETTYILDRLSVDLSNGVVVSSFKYDVDKVAVSFDANNFSDAAKQIMNFKKSEYFTDVELTSIARAEKSIACSITMKIGKQI